MDSSEAFTDHWRIPMPQKWPFLILSLLIGGGLFTPYRAQSRSNGWLFWTMANSANVQARASGVGYVQQPFVLCADDPTPDIALLPGTTSLPEINIGAGENPAFLDSSRYELAEFVRRPTYRYIDSLGASVGLETTLRRGVSLLSGNLPLAHGRLNLVLPELLSANRWEGLRLGLGLATGDSISRRIQLGAYAAYGFSDRSAKFGGYVDVYPDYRRTIRLRVFARDDLRVNGGYRFINTETSLLSTDPDRLLSLLNRFFDRERVAGLQLRVLHKGAWSGEVGFVGGNRQPAAGRNGVASNYRFARLMDGDSIHWPSSAPSFPVSEWSVHLRFAPGESHIRLPDRTYTTPSFIDRPVVSVGYERGLPLKEGSVDFHRLFARGEFNFHLGRLGKLGAVLGVGAAWGPHPLPVQQLLYVRGTGPSGGLFVPQVFQTFDMASFAGDRMVTLHLHHRLGAFKMPFFHQNPVLHLHYSAGWAALVAKERHLFLSSYTASALPLYDLQRGYVEGGLSLSRLHILGNQMGVGFFYGVPGMKTDSLGTPIPSRGTEQAPSIRSWAVKLVLTH